MGKSLSLKLRVVGVVKSPLQERRQDGWEEIVSEIIMDPDWNEGLEDLENFSHIIVLFWLNRITSQERRIIQVHPRGRLDLPLVGVFASRSPMRPNPIGMTVVQLLERRGNVLQVKGLDALDGTPVLDIKPYLPWDCVPEATFPSWVRQLGADHRASSEKEKR